jgi:hypothetical protein
MFFFEKKNQKTFDTRSPSVAPAVPPPDANEIKSFCFFFFRKRRITLSFFHAQNQRTFDIWL